MLLSLQAKVVQSLEVQSLVVEEEEVLTLEV